MRVLLFLYVRNVAKNIYLIQSTINGTLILWENVSYDNFSLCKSKIYTFLEGWNIGLLRRCY